MYERRINTRLQYPSAAAIILILPGFPSEFLTLPNHSIPRIRPVQTNRLLIHSSPCLPLSARLPLVTLSPFTCGPCNAAAATRCLMQALLHPSIPQARAPAVPSAPVRIQTKIGPKYQTWLSVDGYKTESLNGITVSVTTLSSLL